MTLVDAGPLIALLIRQEADHQACVEALATLRKPLLTTWPVFTEAMHILGDWPAQKALWQLLQRGLLQIAEITPGMLEQIPTLMGKYQDIPMDLADASLVALANERGVDRVFTLDSDFEVYRLANKKHFQRIPCTPKSRG